MELCSFPKCHNLPNMGYIGRPICNEHWNKLCSVDSKTEKRWLKKIGLVRDKNGSVVPINPQ